MDILRLFFSFKGRSNRLQYWGGGLAVNIVSWTVMSMMGGVLVQIKSSSDVLGSLAGLGLVLVPLSLLTWWCTQALQIKRMHDRGRSGWMSLLMFAPLIPIIATLVNLGAARADPQTATVAIAPYVGLFLLIGFGFFIDLGCLPGVSGPNRFGDPPVGFLPGRETKTDAKTSSTKGEDSGRLHGAEAALARAVEERLKGNQPKAAPNGFADLVGASRSAAPAGAVVTTVSAATAGGFGRRGL